jgi:hypothetical protein
LACASAFCAMGNCSLMYFWIFRTIFSPACARLLFLDQCGHSCVQWSW